MRVRFSCGLAVMAMAGMAACGPRGPKPGDGDAAFKALAARIIDDYARRSPTAATELGIHSFDAQLEDYSAAAVQAETEAARGFKRELDSIDPASLTPDARLDRVQLVLREDALILQNDVIRSWTRDPDVYSSGITSSAYSLIKRRFAPPADRMRALVGRMKAMPAALAEGRRNLSHPPRVYTEIAIDQIDGNQEFFRTAVGEAFPDVTDKTLLAEFRTANAAVITALGDYKTWLKQDLLPRSDGTFAYGEDTYRRRLAAEEMIETPLDALLATARGDLAKNQHAFAEAARAIDPKRAPKDVLASLMREHPRPDQLLAVTQQELDALRAFLESRHIVTVPAAAPATVKETPPFLRATTSASMDIPGPFETKAAEAYYNMTLPDPAWPAKDREAYMEQWYPALITNVSVHEVWPGHYLQFLYAKHLSSDVRKVFGAASNSEGWAHYAEQMMIDEGFHADDPRYRLAQLQDALLRDVRFIVGISMHTRGMSMAEAEALFVNEAYQPAPVAKSEVRRGTSDATYGYYTMGKLEILKLREDYRRKLGGDYSLQKFHDAFIRVGPLPLPLVREALVGVTPAS